MESSETYSKVIELGKQLVELLGKGRDADLLSRWMSHYIAELIVRAETSTGKPKQTAEKECCNTILALWKHRASFPSGKRPFERFDDILRVLEYLQPGGTRGIYHNFRSGTKDEPSEVQALVDLIVKTDNAARALISSILESAIETAADLETREILRRPLPTQGNKDIQFFKRLMELHEGPSGNESDSSKERLTELTNRLETLDSFERVCAVFKSLVKSEIENIELGDLRTTDGQSSCGYAAETQ